MKTNSNNIVENLINFYICKLWDLNIFNEKLNKFYLHDRSGTEVGDKAVCRK